MVVLLVEEMSKKQEGKHAPFSLLCTRRKVDLQSLINVSTGIMTTLPSLTSWPPLRLSTLTEPQKGPTSS
jgi:hypothetical protein